jgi:hypothetical protein
MAACVRVDEFLDVYGLWEMQASFEFHRIDDMEVVVRLERSHIALLSDRVGIQVLALSSPSCPLCPAFLCYYTCIRLFPLFCWSCVQYAVQG